MANNKEEIKAIVSAENKTKGPLNEAKGDIKSFSREAKQAAQGFDAAGATIAIAAGNIAAQVGLYIGEKALNAIKALTTGAYNVANAWAAAVNDIGDKTGMLDESASRIIGLAKIAGVSADEMGQALMIMSRNLGTNADAFAKWGVNIYDTNGKLLTSEQILNNVLIRHRELANGIEKNRFELELMGRSGGKFNDFLNMSDQQLKAWNDTIEQSGLILSGNMSQAMEDTDQKGRLLNATFEGMQNQIGHALNPALDSMYDGLLKTAQEMANDESVSKALTSVLNGMSIVAQGVANAIIFIGDACAYAFKFVADLYNGLTDLMSKWADSDLSNIASLLTVEGMLDDDAAQVAGIIQKGAQAGRSKMSTSAGASKKPVLGGNKQAGVISYYGGGGGGTSGGGSSATSASPADALKQLEAQAKSLQLSLMRQLGMDTAAIEIDMLREKIAKLKAEGYENTAELELLVKQLSEKLTEPQPAQTFTDQWRDAIEQCKSTFSQFGQDVITGAQSIGDAFKSLLKNIANTILNAAFNKALSGIKIGGISLGHNADGGKASGWTIVGEHGAELVNFSNPARVYSNRDSKALLNGNNNGGNVRVIIENKSGQNVEATSANASFDAEGLILSVVLDAAANNNGGFSQALGGALTAWR